MPANPNWGRWIFASVAYYLKTTATENSLPVLVEEFDERTATFERATDHVEIRITGPMTQEISENYYRLWVDANVLLTSRYDGPKKDPFALSTNAGLFLQAMSAPIPVWNYGNQPGDFVESDPSTQQYLGCLRLRDGKSDSVRLIHLGQIEKVDKIKQAVVDARYYLYLDFDG